MKRRATMMVACVILAGLTMGAQSPSDPVQKVFHFRVEIDGVDAGFFRSVDGLSIEQEVIEVRDGGDNLVRKIPGRVKYGDITLKKGYLGTSMLNDWIEPLPFGGEGSPRKNVSVILLDRQRNNAEVQRWNLFECFPVSWGIPPLMSGNDEHLVEELRITCDFFVEP